ncbi:MAG: helix-turn-helix domain-containing protein [Solirubrobacteraceae bacterium]
MQAAEKPQQLWTADEVAAFLRVPKQDVYLMSRRGQIPTVRLGRRVRFDPRDIELWVDRRTSTRPRGTQ